VEGVIFLLYFLWDGAFFGKLDLVDEISIGSFEGVVKSSPGTLFL